MTFNIIELLSIFIVFLFLFFVAYLLITKTNKKLSNLLFAVYLFIVALDFSAYFYPKFITLSYTGEMIRMEVLAGLKAPILYLYIISVLYDNFKIKIKHILLFVPLFINLIILYPTFFNISIDQQKLFIENYYNQPEGIFITFFGYIIGFAFLFTGVYQVMRYQKIVKQNYSNSNVFINYTWLKQFLIISIIISLITLSKSIYRFTYNTVETTNNLRIAMLLFSVVFISWVFSKALFAPKTFQGIDIGLLPIKEGPNSIEDIRVESIKQFMLDKEPYLDASLTLQKLANQLNIPSRELSVLINQHMDTHFFDFVNEYRIKKAMQKLKNPSFKKHTIQEIMYDVGFNSKTPFNTAFKKHTNTTPSLYRKNS
ncbi:helix-turn-helix domain-containing protein [Aquimarina aquimarini]|uniref:helix-turn-helix domain-containing protein n=1 Tax=Aquimarina aquimarini TaxID=1191734 RepID=UPI000D552A9C|nr:helix-turn-helix domain-containing protein [Aquimarina aquimarini]